MLIQLTVQLQTKKTFNRFEKNIRLRENGKTRIRRSLGLKIRNIDEIPTFWRLVKAFPRNPEMTYRHTDKIIPIAWPKTETLLHPVKCLLAYLLRFKANNVNFLHQLLNSYITAMHYTLVQNCFVLQVLRFKNKIYI